MSNEQEHETNEIELEASDELSSEELDHVVGGTDPKSSANTPTETISFNYGKIEYIYTQQ